MSDYRYPPEDELPPNRDRNRAPQDPSSPNREVDPSRPPDLRRRSSLYREVHEARLEHEARDLKQEKRTGGAGFNLSKVDWIFIAVLIFGAIRGLNKREGQQGCLPSRSCTRVLVLNFVALGAIIGSIYMFAEGGNDRLASALGLVGFLACLLGMGSIFFLALFTVRMINLGQIDDAILDNVSPDGFLGSLFGRR